MYRKDGPWFYDSKNTVERDLETYFGPKGSIRDKPKSQQRNI